MEEMSWNGDPLGQRYPAATIQVAKDITHADELLTTHSYSFVHAHVAVAYMVVMHPDTLQLLQCKSINSAAGYMQPTLFFS